MALSIKNEETHRLVQQLAKRAGETQTEAVTIAVRERLERLERAQGTSLADQLRAISRDIKRGISEPFQSTDHGDLLYDEVGLPR